MNKKILTIGQAAKYLGITVATLRRWSNTGKIKPSNITPGGHRYYSIDDLERVTEDIFSLAKDWVYSKEPFEPKTEYYCPDQPTFQLRLDKLGMLLKSMPEIGEEFSLINLIVGEVGNNSFDHNLGQWPDIRGLFFAYDTQKRKIVLADRGQGVQKTLKRVRPEINNDQEALVMAFTKFISGRAPESRGNGLKLVRDVVKDMIKTVPIKFYFQSGSALLALERGRDYQISPAEQAIRGCLIMITF